MAALGESDFFLPISDALLSISPAYLLIYFVAFELALDVSQNSVVEGNSVEILFVILSNIAIERNFGFTLTTISDGNFEPGFFFLNCYICPFTDLSINGTNFVVTVIPAIANDLICRILEIPDNSVVEGNRELVVRLSSLDTAVNISVPDDLLEVIDDDSEFGSMLHFVDSIWQV